jgi:hypothetical protein
MYSVRMVGALLHVEALPHENLYVNLKFHFLASGLASPWVISTW